MTDRQRIEALVEEGRITTEQADVLIQALGPDSAAEAEAASVPTQPAGAPAAERSAVTRPDPAVKWLEINAFGGDINISVNDSLTQPKSDDLEPVLTETGARIALPERRDTGEQRSFLDRIVDTFRTSNLKVEIPSGWGIMLDVTGGDIDIDGPVAGVRGRLMAGDLTVLDTASAEVTVNAGEAEIGLRSNKGTHRITVNVGQADVRILPGSRLDVEAAVTVGNVSGAGLKIDRAHIGGTGRGSLGKGSGGGKLTITVATGDIRVLEID